MEAGDGTHEGVQAGVKAVATLHGRDRSDSAPVSIQFVFSGKRAMPPSVQVRLDSGGKSKEIARWRANHFDSDVALQKLAATALEVRQWQSASIPIVGNKWVDRLPVSIDYAIDCGSFHFGAFRVLPRIHFKLVIHRPSGESEGVAMVAEPSEVEAFGREMTQALEEWGDWSDHI